MAKSKTVFICRNCGHNAHKWIGQCPGCEEWNSHDEEMAQRNVGSAALLGEAPRRITEITFDGFEAVPTGIPELDRVLGGGLVAG